MATLRCLEEPQTHADWAHFRAQILTLDAPRQIARHGSMTEWIHERSRHVGRHCAQNCAHRVPVGEWVEVVLRPWSAADGGGL